MTRQKGFILPDPVTGYDLICIKIHVPDNERYIQAFWGHHRQLQQYYVWQHMPRYADGRANAAADMWGQIIEADYTDYENGVFCEDDEMQLQVRQSVIDTCKLEYSPDGGLNWHEFADVTLCPDLSGDSYAMTTQLNLTTSILYQTIYDGTPGSINPEAPTGTWDMGGNPDREAALCMAAMSLVGSVAAQELQALYVRYAGATLIFAGLFILTGGLATFGVLVFGSLLTGMTFETARHALEDRAALLEVACCMLNGLTGVAVTQPAFAASLDSCGFTSGSNEAIARDFIHRSIQDETTYLAMLDAAAKAYIQTTVWGVDNCECGGWTQEFDFVTGQHGWTILNPLAGVYVAGVGWNATVYDGTNYAVTLERLLVEREITNVRIFGIIPGNQSYGNRFRLFTTALTYQDISFFVPVPPTMEFEHERVIASKPATKVHSEYPDSNQSYTITKIILQGNGTNPF